MRQFQGFSLIELMIVVSIISILSAIAIPSYQRYTERARFTEVIAIAEQYKTAIALALQEGNAIESMTFGAYDIPDAPKATSNLAGVSIDKGVITATATALIKNVTYILKPNGNGSDWQIGGTCLQEKVCHAG